MELFFEMILQNSLAGTAFIIIILIFRQLTKHMPKIYVRCLWLLLLAELLAPPLIQSPLFSLRSIPVRTDISSGYAVEKAPAFGIKETKEAAALKAEDFLTGQTDPAPKSDSQQGYTPQTETGGTDAKSTQTAMSGFDARVFFGRLYLAGAAGLAFYFMIQYFKMKRRVRMAVRTADGIWVSGKIEVPFVMPGIVPKIYLPAGIDGIERNDIIAHEKQHIRQFDPFIKLVSTAAVILHWFNPFVWLACRMMNRDMEMYCDERVLKGSSFEEKKRYTQTLLDFAVKQRGLPLMLHFGESNTKSRVKHILYARRPQLFISILLIGIVFVCGSLFLTSGSGIRLRPGYNSLERSVLKHMMLAGDLKPEESVLIIGEGGKTASPEEDFVENQIAGTPYVPDDDMAERIKAALDYSTPDRWQVYPLFTNAPDGSAEKEAFYTSVSLIGQSAHFSLYSTYNLVTNQEEGYSYYEPVTFVKTPEGSYIWSDVPFISSYRVQPQLLELDFDGDGAKELAITTLTAHGTGFCVMSLYMADQAPDGSWYLYEFLTSDFWSQLDSHYGTAEDETGVRFLVDGKKAGLPLHVGSEYQDIEHIFYTGDQIDFKIINDTISIEAKAAMRTKWVMGEYYGYGLCADVLYEGEGKFKLTEFRYRDFELEQRVSFILYNYYAGDSDSINELYAVDGFLLKEAYTDSMGRKAAASPEIVDIRYDTDSLESGKTPVTATVRPPEPENDSFDYVMLLMQTTPWPDSEYDGTDIWMLADFWIEN